MQEALNSFQSIFIKQKATKFQIIDGKLMPSLSSIEGMGEKAASGGGSSERRTLSVLDDFRARDKGQQDSH